MRAKAWARLCRYRNWAKLANVDADLLAKTPLARPTQPPIRAQAESSCDSLRGVLTQRGDATGASAQRRSEQSDRLIDQVEEPEAEVRLQQRVKAGVAVAVLLTGLLRLAIVAHIATSSEGCRLGCPYRRSVRHAGTHTQTSGRRGNGRARIRPDGSRAVSGAL